MIKRATWIWGLSLLLAGSAFAQYTNVVYSEPSDGVIEDRSVWLEPQVNLGESGNSPVWAGEWYNSDTNLGLASVVFPFQLPNAGNVTDPFTSAELQLYIEANTLGLSSSIDLYYIRTSAVTNELLATDYYSGSAAGPGTRIVEDFITAFDTGTNYITTSDAALLAELNAAYNTFGAGSYVFLRLSYAVDGWAAAGDLCEVSTRNSSFQNDWPTLTLTDNVDQDSDGLPDSWEISYFGETAISNFLYTGSTDNDLDWLDNSAELALGTNPSTNDTDGDLIIDGGNLAEENNGVFGGEVNGFTLILNSEVGTTFFADPLDSDSDDDGLTDGYEALTNAVDNFYYSNPTNKNTDGDAANDATEVSCNTDPDNASSFPADSTPIIGVDFFDYTNSSIWSLAGGEFFDIDNSTLNDAYLGHTCDISDWYDTSFNAGDVLNQGLLTSGDNLALRSFNGLNTGGQAIGVFSTDPATGSTSSNVYFKVKMTLDGTVDYAGLSFYNGGNERLFFGKTGGNGFWGIDGTNDIDVAVTATYGPTNDIEYAMVGKIDIGTANVTMWIDPVIASGEGSAIPIATTTLGGGGGPYTYNAMRLASGGTGNVRWDDLVVAYTWDDLDFAGTDSDADSLRDTWELIWTNTLATLASGSDFDSDTLNDEVELALLTDPTSSDSDGDGINDGVEVGTYGTDPANADTDGDNLSDGFEITTSGSTNVYITDPLKADTDEDGYDDDVEIALGTDPTDPNDSPGGIIIDGSRDGLYGAPVAVQTIETGFGDNESEWNAAYSYSTNGYLYLLFTGNLQNNGNRLEIFIDSTDDITGNVLTAAGNDSTSVMDGMIFDTAFSPEYHLNMWRDGAVFNFDFADLVVTNWSSYTNIFGGASEGANEAVGTGPANASPIAVAHNDSNIAGIGGTAGVAADTNAAVAVTTGLELRIALSDLGSPTGTVKVALMQNGNSPHGYLSNQMLGGLPVGTGNLGGDGAGTWMDGLLTNIDLTTFAGDQFFTVGVQPGAVIGPFSITDIQLINGNADVQLILNGLALGQDYKIQDAVDLTAGFTDVGSPFTATNETAHTVVLPADTGAEPERFFQGAVAP